MSCDGIAQCPEASDEAKSGCTCEDWALKSCKIDGYEQTKCINKNWSPTEEVNKSNLECYSKNTILKLTENHSGECNLCSVIPITRLDDWFILKYERSHQHSNILNCNTNLFLWISYISLLCSCIIRFRQRWQPM